MQVVENRSDITGRVTGVSPHPTLPDHSLLTVQLDDVAPVDGFANLFDAARGKTIEVAVSRERANQLGLQTGDSVVARIRRAGPTSVFAEDDSVARS